MNRSSKLKFKTLKKRFSDLKKPFSNNFEEVLSLDDIYKKSSVLLVDHEKYNEMKKINHPNTEKVLSKLLDSYNRILQYIGMYSNDKKVGKLKKSLELNLKELYKNDVKNEINNRDIPTVKEIEERLNKLVKFSDSLRKKK